ncbi:MAG: PTS sugar transporter subunit IIA, partial [Thermoanaerobaculia bacterium]
MIGGAADPILARWIRPGTVLRELTATSAVGVLEEIANDLARALPGISAAALRSAFSEREALGTTAIGHGFAVPHCRLAGVKSVDLRVALHPSGVAFGAADGTPVRVFFVLV